MKIIILSSEFPPGPGGIGTHAYQLASGLSSLGHEIFVLACQDYALDEDVRIFNGSQRFETCTLKSGAGKIKRLFTVYDKLNRFKPELVVVTGDSSVYLGALLKIISKAVFCAIEHGRIPGGTIERIIKKWAFSRIDRIISVSGYTRKRLIESGYIKKDSGMIHNGADARIFRKLPEPEWKCYRYEYPDAQILMTVGNVSERKGQETVLRALPEIIKQFPKTIYWMAGLPTIKTKLENLAKKLGVEKNIHFLGKISQTELVRRLNAADIFLMTSIHASSGDFEGFGIAVAEAALCGKPAIVSDNSGLIEAIIPGKTGLAVPEKDEKAVAEAVKKLLSSNSVRLEMGSEAFKFSSQNQTWDRCVLEYEKLFLSWISQAESL